MKEEKYTYEILKKKQRTAGITAAVLAVLLIVSFFIEGLYVGKSQHMYGINEPGPIEYYYTPFVVLIPIAIILIIIFIVRAISFGSRAKKVKAQG